MLLVAVKEAAKVFNDAAWKKGQQIFVSVFGSYNTYRVIRSRAENLRFLHRSQSL